MVKLCHRLFFAHPNLHIKEQRNMSSFSIISAASSFSTLHRCVDDTTVGSLVYVYRCSHCQKIIIFFRFTYLGNRIPHTFLRHHSQPVIDLLLCVHCLSYHKALHQSHIPLIIIIPIVRQVLFYFCPQKRTNPKSIVPELH